MTELIGDLWSGIINVIEKELQRACPKLSRSERNIIAVKVVGHAAPEIMNWMQTYVDALYKVFPIRVKVKEKPDE